MTICERLFAEMAAKGLKMIDLANELGINKSVISAWKARKSNPPVEYTDCICRFLGISFSYYLTGRESDNEVFLTNEEISLLKEFRNLCPSQKKEARRYMKYIKNDDDDIAEPDTFSQGQQSSISKRGKKHTASPEETA